MCVFCLFFCIWCCFQVAAIPFETSIQRKDAVLDSGASKSSVTTSINITNFNHVDVTQDFKVMVYLEPHSAINNNVSNSTLQPRNIFQPHRPITSCVHSQFVESHCTPEDNKVGSLQSYSITCAFYEEYRNPITGEFHEARTVHRRRTGHCLAEEICVDNFGSTIAHFNQRWAVCVKKSLFDGTMYGPGDGESVQMIDRVLEKGGFNSAYMVVSDDDGSTPAEVDFFNFDSWPSLDSKQSQSCRDCMKLDAKSLAPDMNALKAEARLLTTGAAAGILWLALMAG